MDGSKGCIGEELYAVKIECRDKDRIIFGHSKLVQEANMLREMTKKGCEVTPKYFDSGPFPGNPSHLNEYLVMTYLPHPATSALPFRLLASALEAYHKVLGPHGSLSPSSFRMSPSNRLYIQPPTFKVDPVFISLAQHTNGRVASLEGDYESLIYSFKFLRDGQLPWYPSKSAGTP